MARTDEIAEAMARVGAALRELPLARLPDVYAATIRAAVLARPLRVELQLVASPAPAAGLLAWAEALPGSTATASWGKGYIDVKVSGELAGLPVVVWDHLRGAAEARQAARHLALGADRSNRTPVTVSLAALRRLAGQGVPCDA